MVLDKYPALFRTLRFLTIVVTLTIIALEILQNQTFSHTQISNLKSNLYGIKIFFYIVIAITIIVSGIQFVKFNILWNEGPFIRDIVFGIGFALLWIVAGLANIYAYYFAPEMTCPGYSVLSEIPWELQLKCNSYLSITALCWLNIVIFLLSTILYWKLWIDKINQSRNPNQRTVILMARV